MNNPADSLTRLLQDSSMVFLLTKRATHRRNLHKHFLLGLLLRLFMGVSCYVEVVKAEKNRKPHKSKFISYILHFPPILFLIHSKVGKERPQQRASFYHLISLFTFPKHTKNRKLFHFPPRWISPFEPMRSFQPLKGDSDPWVFFV